MRVAKNDYDDKAELRGYYGQLPKYTHTRARAHSLEYQAWPFLGDL